MRRKLQRIRDHIKDGNDILQKDLYRSALAFVCLQPTLLTYGTKHSKGQWTLIDDSNQTILHTSGLFDCCCSPIMR